MIIVHCIHFSYLNKLAEFLKLFVSLHFKRLEAEPEFDAIEFLSYLFQYTFQVCFNFSFKIILNKIQVHLTQILFSGANMCYIYKLFRYMDTIHRYSEARRYAKVCISISYYCILCIWTQINQHFIISGTGKLCKRLSMEYWTKYNSNITRRSYNT